MDAADFSPVYHEEDAVRRILGRGGDAEHARDRLARRDFLLYVELAGRDPAAAVAEPTGLRIGIAGVLLNFHSPVAVASDFSLLELYFSGRLDFGVAGAGLRPDTSPLRPALLDGRPEPDRASYAEKVRELVRLMRRRPAARDALDAAEVGPAIATSPPIWLRGTSTETAELAGMLGLPYAFHHYLSHASADASYGLGVIQRYLDTFQPNDQLDAPEYNVACYGICAETDERAQAIWRAQLAGSQGNPATDAGRARDDVPSFLGHPERCLEQLRDLRQHYETGELVLHTMADELGARLTSYRLLAHAFALPPRPAMSSTKGP